MCKNVIIFTVIFRDDVVLNYTSHFPFNITLQIVMIRAHRTAWFPQSANLRLSLLSKKVLLNLALNVCFYMFGGQRSLADK